MKEEEGEEMERERGGEREEEDIGEDMIREDGGRMEIEDEWREEEGI